MGIATDLVAADSILQWIIIACFVGYFIYKEWPGFRKRMTDGAKKAQAGEDAEKTVEKRLDELERRVEGVEGKLADDFVALKALRRDEDRDKELFRQILEENEIMMNAMLGVIGGLQELGADGPTKEAEREIMDYLKKKAHSADL
ncbi:MAG: hypothetical protein LUD50_02850 [Clostridia bacterium]|nr:hypothetical protein [Clostridia bacterium]